MNGADVSLVTLRRDDLESLDLGPSGEATVAGVSSVASSLVGGVTPGEEGVELVRTEFVFSCAHGHDHLSLAALTAAMRPSSRPSTRIRSSRPRRAGSGTAAWHYSGVVSPGDLLAAATLQTEAESMAPKGPRSVQNWREAPDQNASKSNFGLN